MSNSKPAAPAVDTLYTVAMGDSLSSIAQRFYGDARYATDIAKRNGIEVQDILFIGRRIVLPGLQRTASSTGTASSTVEEVQVTAQRLPESPGGSVPVNYGGQVIETVTTTASVWWKDWRYWAAITAGMGVLYWLSRRRT